jgi:predicted Zn-dependent protease with MMP-like domain
MICHIGLVLEFKDQFTEEAQFRLYGGMWDKVGGISREETNEAWIFVDNLALYDLFDGYDIVESITDTVVHELIHLCGVQDENIVGLGERLVK